MALMKQISGSWAGGFREEVRTAVLASRVRVTQSVVRIDLTNCIDIQNSILPLTQSTNRLWWVSQLYLRMVEQNGSIEVTRKSMLKTSPVGNWTLSMIFDFMTAAEEPSKRQSDREIGFIRSLLSLLNFSV